MKNKQNIIFILAVACVSLIILGKSLLRNEGGNAIVQFGNGEAVKISLADNGTHTLDNGALPIHLKVENGSIRFVNSECPDHVCEGFGWLSKEEDQAICAPARASVTIEP